MSLVTLGLDFGTSSVKCVARPAMGSNADVVIIPSTRGALRWRSMLGRVTFGREAGRLLLFDECDDPEWRHDAMFEPNLKLALLLDGATPAAQVLSRRWGCNHFALPTLLLAAAVHQATTYVKARWPNDLLHVYMGAPISPRHPAEQLARFERALHAAIALAERWSSGIPAGSDEALAQASDAWDLASRLPDPGKRTAFVVPEAFAACEGVSSVSGGVPLPEGRHCVVDMGGGTTDVAWIDHDGVGQYTPLRIDSFDIAGDRLEAIIAHDVSRRSGTRVTRQELWAARAASGNDGRGLEGANWKLHDTEIGAVLRGVLHELAQKFAVGLSAIDGDVRRGPPTTLALVGGATKWQLLGDLLRDALEPFHERVEIVSVEDFGLRGAHADLPLAVALGLSQGFGTLDPARWSPALRPKAEPSQERDVPRFKPCPCGGQIHLCVKCGGSGNLTSEEREPRFAESTDPYKPDAFSIRCPHCRQDFSPELIRDHLSRAHYELAPVPPRAAPRTQTESPTPFRIEAVRKQLRGEHSGGLSAEESIVANDLTWLQAVWLESGDSRDHTLRWFLTNSIGWSARHPWCHFPRAIAFAALPDTTHCDRELRSAQDAGFRYCEEIVSILSSDRDTRFAEAWECVLR